MTLDAILGWHQAVAKGNTQQQDKYWRHVQHKQALLQQYLPLLPSLTPVESHPATHETAETPTTCCCKGCRLHTKAQAAMQMMNLFICTLSITSHALNHVTTTGGQAIGNHSRPDPGLHPAFHPVVGRKACSHPCTVRMRTTCCAAPCTPVLPLKAPTPLGRAGQNSCTYISGNSVTQHAFPIACFGTTSSTKRG
jgi:hypothetical protein